METIKNLFRKKQTPKNLETQSTFDHSKLSSSDDISQCPFMKNKKQKQPQLKEAPSVTSSAKCPFNGKKNKEEKNKQDKQAQSSSDEQQIPKGGCPFVGGSQKKRNPDLFQTAEGYDVPFVSKFNYYLSANKIDFSLLRKKKGHIPISRSRQTFNGYPIYLQHTLFFNGDDYKKVRGLECCSRFLPYEKLREKGNKYFNKKLYAEALDYYERALSLFKWLEYFEEDKQKSISSIPSQQSIESTSNLPIDEGSKVHLELNSSEEQQGGIFEKDDQLDVIEQKYKEFFVFYTDGNVKLYDGEQMEETPDIDMRKSLMLQVLLNMSTAYFHLNHFSVALQCIEDCFKLTDKVSQVYLRKAQTLIFNKGHTLQDAYEARRCMEKALELKRTEKIFQSNENILKMVNLHNAGQAYQKTLDYINLKIAQRQKQVETIKQKIYQRAIEINKVQKRLIQEGKTAYERHQESMQDSKEFKILLRMKQKYLKVIEFYTEAQNKEQITLANRQLQQLTRVFADMNTVMGIRIEQKQDQLGGIHTQKIQKRINTIKKNYCEEIYNTGKFNFTVMQWAIKQIIKEERQEEELKKKMQDEQKRANDNHENSVQKEGKNSLLGKFSWGLVLIPIAGILINQFLMI